jgi:uncharacterized membrane protein
MTGALIRYAPFAAAAVLLAAMVHILTVLAMPRVALRTAGQMLAAHPAEAGPQLAPQHLPGTQATPFADPAMAIATCQFDLKEGPFRIRAQMGETFGSLVILDPRGGAIHGLSDKAATRRLLDVVLATDMQLRAIEAQDPEDRPVQEVRLRMPVTRGVAVVRMLVPRPSDQATVTETLRRLQCAPSTDG